MSKVVYVHEHSHNRFAFLSRRIFRTLFFMVTFMVIFKLDEELGKVVQ